MDPRVIVLARSLSHLPAQHFSSPPISLRV
jgi:hypothetical protein